MKLFLERNKYFFGLVFVFIIAEIIVNPLGEFPLIDDWCYAYALSVFYKTGEINFGNYPAMTLYTQILWGYGFTKIFGLSSFILRCSSLFSALIGFAFLNSLVVQITGNRQTGALACLVLMLNPLVFCLGNTYMTDVNFNTLVIMGCYFMYKFFRTNHIAYYFLFAVSGILLVMLRQYGMVLPACFIFACFFSKRRRVLNIVLAVAAFAITFWLLKIYEEYLHGLLPAGSSFKFSDTIHLSDQVFWDKLLNSFNFRYKEIIRHMLMYTAPLAIVFLPGLIRSTGIKIMLAVLPVIALVLYVLFHEEHLASANIFSYMILGPETFYESSKGARHNVYPAFDELMFYVRLVSCAITLFILMIGFIRIIALNKWRTLFKPEIVFFIALIFAYAFMVLITESYFDRYHIPLITIVLILMAYLSKMYGVNVKYAIVPLLFWAWVSIAGTKDYMALNRKKWEAYRYLRDLNVPPHKANGGLEINCWNDNYSPFWRDFTNLDTYDYLIQFDKEPGFKQIKEYEFQRYFPYKKDKIYIFVREDAKNKKL